MSHDLTPQGITLSRPCMKRRTHTHHTNILALKRNERLRLLMHLVHMSIRMRTTPLALIVAANIRPRIRRHDARPVVVAQLAESCFGETGVSKAALREDLRPGIMVRVVLHAQDIGVATNNGVRALGAGRQGAGGHVLSSLVIEELGSSEGLGSVRGRGCEGIEGLRSLFCLVVGCRGGLGRQVDEGVGGGRRRGHSLNGSRALARGGLGVREFLGQCSVLLIITDVEQDLLIGEGVGHGGSSSEAGGPALSNAVVGGVVATSFGVVLEHAVAANHGVEASRPVCP